MTATLTLNHDALGHALAADANLDDCNAQTPEDYALPSFSDTTCKAIAELVYKAFHEWRCLVQSPTATAARPARPWHVQVYPLDSEYENNMLVTVRRDGGPLLQLSTLTIDADKLVEDPHARSGPQLLIDVLEAVLNEANRLIDNARAHAPALTA